jgi:hypothetical protein
VSSWMPLLLISPFLALTLVLGVVAVIALRRARVEDVPAVLSICVAAFTPLINRLPRETTSPAAVPDDPDTADVA